MNRRSFVVAGALLTAGCTSSTPEETSPTSADDSDVPKTTSPNPATATATTSLETAEVGSESDLPERTIPREIHVHVTSGSGVSLWVDRLQDVGLGQRYSVSSRTDFELTIYPPADYTVEIQASRGRSATIDVKESSFTCESAITVVSVSESMLIDPFEREPDASCDAPEGGSSSDAAENETSTTTTTGADKTTSSTVTAADS